MNSLETTVAITGIANAIACGLTVSELAFLASIFVQIGDTWATIAAQEALRQECAEAKEATEEE